MCCLKFLETRSYLLNFIGLLKKLVVDDSGCENLMTLTEEGVTFLTCLKKLMLSKKDTLQTGVSQILSLILRRDTYKQYAVAILESDIVGKEFWFDSRKTAFCIFKWYAVVKYNFLSEIENIPSNCFKFGEFKIYWICILGIHW